MTDLRTAAQQALEVLVRASSYYDTYAEIEALRAALEEPVQEPDPSRCPQCGGPADNGHDRSIPPSPYFCTKCMAEPVPVAWMHVPYPGSGLRQMVSLIRNREPSLYAATVPLYAAPPQRKPLTEEEIESMWEADTTSAEDCQSLYYFKVVARAIERAHRIGGKDGQV
jgi:hypothetical protein